MAEVPPTVLERPKVRDGTTYQTLTNGAVYISGPLIDAFITDDGTATVLQACDGRTLSEMCEGFKARYGWDLTEEDLVDILGSWAKVGYLEGTRAKSRRLARFNPAGLLRLFSPLQSLYGRRLTAIVAAFFAIAGYVLTLLYGTDIVAALSTLARTTPPLGAVALIIGYYLGYSVTAFFHELGHALAVRRFDGEVPEIGIQRNTNFYVLANREVLQTSQARIWYYAGGLLSDTVWWLIAWIWWLLAPGAIPLFLLVPQTVYFLVFAYAPSGNSDMAKVLRETVGWPALARPGRGWSGKWKKASVKQKALELLRLAAAAGLVVYLVILDVLLIGLYVVYRLARKGLNRI
ncbi:MAG: hypothetical protein KAT18_08990 [Candidatus Latescibacteria bacterium]|nr:hypothetical protein [Candidatus Latescibacterota bacterium]